MFFWSKGTTNFLEQCKRLRADSGPISITSRTHLEKLAVAAGSADADFQI